MTAPRRLLSAVIVAAALVVAAGCQARAEVGVRVHRNGSGTVTMRVILDADAARRLGTGPTAGIDTSDLTGAGWTVAAPTTRRGTTVVEASKPFASPAALGEVLAEIGGTGDSGVFAGFRLSVTDGFGSTGYRLAGSVHFAGSAEQFSDAELAKVLDGLPLARSADELRAELGAHPSVPVRFAVTFPAAVDSAAGAAVDGGTASWRFDALGRASTRVVAEATDATLWPLLWFAVAAALVLVALAVAVASARRRAPAS